VQRAIPRKLLLLLLSRPIPTHHLALLGCV